MNTDYLINRPHSDFANCPNNVLYNKSKIKIEEEKNPVEGPLWDYISLNLFGLLQSDIVLQSVFVFYDLDIF